MKKVLLLFLSMILTGCTGLGNIPNQTVMITNMARSSGGSGSIIETSFHMSKVLTNGHVCEVVRKGGLVITGDRKAHLVTNFTKSLIHDLCLIEVAEDLKYSANVSGRPPYLFEKALISGHPHLNPTTITEGYFSHKKVVQVVMGYKDCAPEDFANPNTQIFCMFIGKLPLIKQFESIFVTALIQPGSSGSAIYNSSGYLDAVVFAGGGDIGYAFAVPYEYIVKFLDEELKTLPREIPGSSVEMSDMFKSDTSIEKEYEQLCDDLETKNHIQETICAQIAGQNKLRR